VLDVTAASSEEWQILGTASIRLDQAMLESVASGDPTHADCRVYEEVDEDEMDLEAVDEHTGGPAGRKEVGVVSVTILAPTVSVAPEQRQALDQSAYLTTTAATL
ncbi:hypothetical protein KIPB_016733, partial [Kipferlia bialata]